MTTSTAGRIILGIAIGALAMWLWDHREDIGWFASNHAKLTGAQKIIQGLKEVGAP
jgi:uncharacterized membrane protein YeaQ/YmgE (transglycosylase-associated protein family)